MSKYSCPHSKDLLCTFCEPLKGCPNVPVETAENKLQTKIMNWLKDQGHYAVKVVQATRNGVPDIVGCTSWGQFFAIEVKVEGNKASKLQEYNLVQIDRRGGIAVLAYNLQTVIMAFEQKQSFLKFPPLH